MTIRTSKFSLLFVILFSVTLFAIYFLRFVQLGSSSSVVYLTNVSYNLTGKLIIGTAGFYTCGSSGCSQTTGYSFFHEKASGEHGFPHECPCKLTDSGGTSGTTNDKDLADYVAGSKQCTGQCSVTDKWNQCMGGDC